MTRLAIIAAASLLLAGCASFSPDGGFGKVSQLTQERTGQGVALQRSPEDAQTARNRVAELLQAALTADAAVEVALLNNRGLQAKFGDLGIAPVLCVGCGILSPAAISVPLLAQVRQRRISFSARLATKLAGILFQGSNVGTKLGQPVLRPRQCLVNP